jgi:hypothetical protein
MTIEIKRSPSYFHQGKTKRIFITILCTLILLTSLILPSTMNFKNQFVNAQTTADLKTFDAKMKINKKIIELGDDVKVTITVRDYQGGDRLSGVLVKVATLYAGAKTIQQQSTITDADGKATIIIQTSEKDLSGVNIVEATVRLTGYQDAILALSFGTTGTSVPDVQKCNDDDDDDDDDDCFA